LIEIVVVITITAMLMSAVTVYALGTWRSSRISAARLDTRNALAALDVYLATKGRYPDPAEGFAPVIKLRALKTVPKDPWGHALVWELRDGEPVVISLGADGVRGGEDDDADLTSSDVE
jgi:general secretion pathway protein G